MEQNPNQAVPRKTDYEFGKKGRVRLGRCDGHDGCFERLYDKTETIRSEMAQLNNKISDFLIKFVNTDSEIKLVRTEHKNLEKEVLHLRKMLHGAAGIILTMVLTSIMYLVLKGQAQ